MVTRNHRTSVITLAALALAASSVLAADPTLTMVPQTYVDGFGDQYTAQRISITGFSADGTTVFGTIRANPNGGSDNDRGYTYRLDSGPSVGLLQFPQFGYVTLAAGIAPDGNVAYGSATLSKSGSAIKNAVWWGPAGNATDLGIPSGARSAVATSGDAANSAFAGSAAYVVSGSTTVTRPILWSAGQAQVLNGPAGMPLVGSAVSISGDGTAILVQSAGSSTGYYNWTAGAVTEVPNPAASRPYAVTSTQISTPPAGVQSLADFLANHGLPLLDTGTNAGVAQFSGVASVVAGGRLRIAENNADQHTSAVASLDLPAAPTAWNVDANGDFSSAANWTAGSAVGEGAYARLGNAISAPRTVSVNSAWELSHLFLDSEQGYALAGAGALLLRSPVTPELRVDSGSHTIGVPLTFACDIGFNTGVASRDAIITVARAQDTLTVSGITVDDGNAQEGLGFMPLDKYGPGTLVLAPGTHITANNINITDGTVRAGNLTLPAATVTLNPAVNGHPALEVDSINVGGVELFAGTLKINPAGHGAPANVVERLRTADLTGFNSVASVVDLTDNSLVLRYRSGQYLLGERSNGHYEDALTGGAEAGRNGGKTGLWTGYGLTSSLAFANPSLYAVGVASAAQLFGISGTQTATFMGQVVSPNDTLARLTYTGDTDLNGYVDGSDLANLFAGMHGGLNTWANGDLNYDGIVNQGDLDLLTASLLNQGAPLGGGGNGQGAVPEPSAIAGLPVAGLLLRRKRR